MSFIARFYKKKHSCKKSRCVASHWSYSHLIMWQYQSKLKLASYQKLFNIRSFAQIITSHFVEWNVEKYRFLYLISVFEKFGEKILLLLSKRFWKLLLLFIESVNSCFLLTKKAKMFSILDFFIDESFLINRL